MSDSNSLSKEYILEQADRLFPQTVGIRRYLHTHPELSFNEKETSAFIAKQLDALGIPYHAGYAKYGIVALVEGDRPGPVIGLRADMDALPIVESPSHTVRSANEGVMHACGHDLHTASLLAVAQILVENRHALAGRYLLIFQPGEEVWPGGASLMLAEGALSAFGFEPDVMLGAHVLAEMPVGSFGFCPGAYMASGDEIHLYIRGRGGHGGMPHLLTDNVLIGCETVVAMQHLIAREVPATVPLLLSFGKFAADGATNVIPDDVYVAGTMRSMNEEWRAKMKTRIRTVATSLAAAYGAECRVEIKDGYPSVYNNPDLTALVRSLAVALVGDANVVDMPIRTTAEDFGYYSHVYPSVFYRFGVKNPSAEPAGAHTAAFCPDEEALRTAPAMMAWAATQLAENPNIKNMRSYAKEN